MLLSRSFAVYNDWLIRKPLLTRAATTGILMCTGDVLAQFTFSKKEEKFQFKRMLRAFTIGFAFTGPSLYIWYNKILPKIFMRPAVSQFSVKQKALVGVVLDQAMFGWWTVSLYMFWSNFLTNWSLSQAWKNVREKVPGTMVFAWMLWPWVVYLNLSYVPLNYRVLTVNIVSLFWNFILSFRNSKAIPNK